MLIIHLCVMSIDVGHVFLCLGYQYWSCISVPRHRCWSCICVLVVSMLDVYLCVRCIAVGYVFVC
jgi:hypothetical protein